MIRRVRIIHREISVWVRGSTYETPLDAPFAQDQILFEKNYPRKTPTGRIWEEIRSQMIVAFFGIFYPVAVDATAEPATPTRNPDVALSQQTQHIRERQTELPDYYEWDAELGKWHISEEGYIKRVVQTERTPTVGDLDREMDIAVSDHAFGDLYDFTLLDELQEKFKGETRSVILFVYPDRYDQLIRSMFELEITFWD